MDDLAYTLSRRRRHYPFRTVIVCADIDGARDGMAHLMAQGPAASGMVELAVAHAGGSTVAVAAARWVNGEDVDWSAAVGDTGAYVTSLPGHPLVRRSYWIDPPARGGRP